MLKGLFLDDERNPDDVFWVNYGDDKIDWIIVRTASQFCDAMLYDGPFDIISFDHDLQDFSEGKEHTGYDCVKWMCNKVDVDTNLIVEFHTQNPIGKKNMVDYWYSYCMFKEN